MTTAPLVLASLVLAHLLADFVFQTDSIAVGKFGNGRGAWAWLAAHGAIVGVCTLPFVLIFGERGLIYALLTTLTHFAIDRSKIVMTQRAPKPVAEAVAEGGDPSQGPPLDRGWSARPAALFVLDQLVHLALLAVLWFLVLMNGTTSAFWNDIVNRLVDASDPATVYRVTLGLVVIVDLSIFNVRAASLLIATLVRAPQPGSPSKADAVPEARIGAVIGILERLIVVSLVLAGEFAAIGLVVTAKTIARFKQLDDRQFAEYYLLGTLASISVAVITGLVAAAALR